MNEDRDSHPHKNWVYEMTQSQETSDFKTKPNDAYSNNFDSIQKQPYLVTDAYQPKHSE
jgi:hypothetical protein